MTSSNGHRSPASRVMDEALELAIEERSPYPERSTFIDADTPYTEREMTRAARRGQSVVLVSPDCSTRVLEPAAILGPGATGAG
jgi:hypothetical protein